jgi:8-oxo-dGTP pyrophosphatase MutT (NUDIX family)
VNHGERTLFESPWVTVGLADVEMPSGERFEHHVLSLPRAAMTVVLDDASASVLMSWRHRFVPDVWNWELPGGLLDENEEPIDTAAREVLEETGYRVRNLEHLVTFEPMIGMVRNAHHVFLARGAELVADPTELNEGKFQWLPLSDVPDLIRTGKIVNSGSLVGLLHLLALGGAKSSDE